MVKSKSVTGRLSEYLELRDDYHKAINFSKAIRDRERRRGYLLYKAQGFLMLQEYDQAAMIAWHILYQVDTTSPQAQQILTAAYSHIFKPETKA